MIALVFALACGGGGELDQPHAPPEWPVAARPSEPAPAPVAPPAVAPVEAAPGEAAPTPAGDTDATP